MSYFSTEKKINMAILTLHSNAIQTIGSVYEDVNIFIPSAVPTTTQIASSIKFPIITTQSSPSTITLESGWKYLIQLKFKFTDTTPSLSENFNFIATDTLNNQISSIGSVATFREGAIAFVQEKCVFYYDATSSELVFKARVKKTDTNPGSGLNVNGDSNAVNFKCHILIKAWR
jgi:hypothetical protein